LYAWRWQVLLVASGVRAPLSITVRQYFIGVFLNNFLPSTVGGDIAKVYLLRAGLRVSARDRVYLSRSHARHRPAGRVLRNRDVVGRDAAAGASRRSHRHDRDCRRGGRAAGADGGRCTGGLARRVAWLGHRAVDVAGKLQRLRLDVAAGLMRPVVVLQAAWR
jgi:hypothetical protein